MDPKLLKFYNEIKARGLTPEQEESILSELYDEGTHDIPDSVPDAKSKTFSDSHDNVYAYDDFPCYNPCHPLPALIPPVSDP